MANLKKAVDSQKQQLERLKQEVNALTMENAVDVDKNLEKDLRMIMEEKTEEIRKQYPPASFCRLFWEQQVEAMKAKDRRQMRWHPMLIKWCLNLKLLYHALRSSDLLVLPLERTLRYYVHFVKAKAGFQLDLDQHLLREAKFDSIPEYIRSLCASFLMKQKSKKTLCMTNIQGN